MLSEEQRLKLQQLRLLEAIEQRAKGAKESGPATDGQDHEVAASVPGRWSMTGEMQLHPWQEEARQTWFKAGCQGTIKVVTGAGKTVLALAIAERLQERDRDLRVAIVVPMIVLMHQWHDTILKHSNLPAEAIGLLGGGHSSDFTDDRRIIIAVLASARKALPTMVERADIGRNLLLIVDESHRAGAPEMSHVLKTPRAYSLGLSATPERDDELLGEHEDDGLKSELGEIVFELTFAEAINEDILPPFEVHHYGLPLNAKEARRYTSLTRSINDTRRELRAISPAARKSGGGGGLLQWARRVASRSGQVSAVAARYVNDMTQRKQLLYRAESRAEAALSLVRDVLATRKDARVILFHESINEVSELFERLTVSGIPGVMEHSELPLELRERSLELFRAGTAQVIVSARSLIEGFDVPEADLGIVVASSTSARQRIQSIGRVLRKYKEAGKEQKSSRVCVLYIRETVDEAIYEKQDWDRLIGLDRNRYFVWDPPQKPLEQEGSPRAPIPREDEIDVQSLQAGDEYPGRYEGEEYSADTHGNVVDADRRIALNPQDIPAAVIAVRGQPGRFRVTPRRRAVLVRKQDQEENWTTHFAGVLEEAFAFPEESQADGVQPTDLEPGDTYRGPLTPATEYRFRQRAGGTIAKKIRGGEAFARGADADRLVEVLRRVSHAGPPVSRFYVNDLGHAFWRQEGAARFIGALEGELEFPERRT